jgi:3-methylcrotonyl-CoA carboxylase alpha subunit
VWGEDRSAAVRQLAGALAEYEVVGVQTNLGLLRAIATHPAFDRAELDTGFIARHADTLMPAVPPALSDADERAIWAGAALAVLADQRAEKEAEARVSGDPWSPWAVADAWRMNGDGYQDLTFRRGEDPVTLRTYPQPDGTFRLDLAAGSVRADAVESDRGTYLRVDGVSHRLRVIRRGAELTVILAGQNHVLHQVDPLAPPRVEAAGDNKLTAPIPARVSRVLVQPGDTVKKGAVLLVLEAMKMELTLSAPLDGTVETLRHAVGDMVEEGTELITFAETAA